MSLHLRMDDWKVALNHWLCWRTWGFQKRWEWRHCRAGQTSEDHNSDTLPRRLCLLMQRAPPSRTELFLACATRLMDVCLEGWRLVGYVVGGATAHLQCSWTIWLDLLCWEPRSVQDVYELPNGCLCCSAKAVQTGGSQQSLHDEPVSWEWCQDGLIGMLDVLLEQKDRFDYVLVEADGRWSLPHCDNDVLRNSQWMDQCRRPGLPIQKLFVRRSLHNRHISITFHFDVDLLQNGKNRFYTCLHAFMPSTFGPQVFWVDEGLGSLMLRKSCQFVFHQQVPGSEELEIPFLLKDPHKLSLTSSELSQHLKGSQVCFQGILPRYPSKVSSPDASGKVYLDGVLSLVDSYNMLSYLGKRKAPDWS